MSGIIDKLVKIILKKRNWSKIKNHLKTLRR